MFERGLLERVAAPGPPGSREAVTDVRAVCESVIRHLGEVFNVRQGNAAIDPQFGLPELGDIESTFELQREIRDLIKRCEPRVANVQVRAVDSADDRTVLRFEIVADVRVQGEREPTPIKLESVLADGRTWRLTG